MDDKEKGAILELIAKRLVNLEYQLNNKAHLTKAQVNQVKSDYVAERKMLVNLIEATAAKMGYPEPRKWSDSKPMSVLNDLSGGKLAGTEAYQDMLMQLIMT